MTRTAVAALLLGCALTACGQVGNQPASPEPPHRGEESNPPQVEPAPAETPSAERTPDAKDCGGKTCTPPEQCIQYSGIAGPRYPLYTCGIPCDAEGGCPEGMTCAIIADGPRKCR
ncbi:MAG: hypothetical protein OXT09_16105 [Myxococcales bacterium]|nr:hypothetical protein [Myxococcales bacterium]